METNLDIFSNISFEEKDLWELSNHLERVNWKYLGRDLGLKPRDIDILRTKHKDDEPLEIMHDMLTAWHEQFSNNCNLATLVRALEKREHLKTAKRICGIFLKQQYRNSTQGSSQALEEYIGKLNLKLNELEFINEQEKIQHMKERDELQAKVAESNKKAEDIKNRMREYEIAFQKQKEELEQIMKDKNMKKEQMKEIIEEINRKQKEEQDELQMKVLKYQLQMDEMTNKAVCVTSSKSENKKQLQMIQENETDRNDLLTRMVDMKEKNAQEMAILFSKLSELRAAKLTAGTQNLGLLFSRTSR